MTAAAASPRSTAVTLGELRSTAHYHTIAGGRQGERHKDRSDTNTHTHTHRHGAPGTELLSFFGALYFILNSQIVTPLNSLRPCGALSTQRMRAFFFAPPPPAACEFNRN